MFCKSDGLKAAMTMTLVGGVVMTVLLGQVPDRFTNLKLLDSSIPKKELVDQMKAMTFALGTRCWYCHQGEGDDLSTYDFASDAKTAKQTARKHMEMTKEFNQKFFAGSEAAVSCNTCHRGQAKPGP